jgi:hypothetical protein
MAAPKQTDPQFKLRMTPEIKKRIEKSAAENNRSMNAEILARLEHSFDSSRAFEPNKSIAERLALADELMDLARGLMLQEVEIAKRENRDIDLEKAKRVSDDAKKRARSGGKASR